MVHALDQDNLPFFLSSSNISPFENTVTIDYDAKSLTKANAFVNTSSPSFNKIQPKKMKTLLSILAVHHLKSNDTS